MSRHYYVETLPDGRKQFVTVKRSKSYHYHHHPHNGEYYKVRRDEWNRLTERCRSLEDANQAFANADEALRTNLSAAKAEVQNLSQVVVPQLQGQIATLQADNQALRRSLDCIGDHAHPPPPPPPPSSPGHHREAERFRRKAERLEKEIKGVREENDDLRIRNEELSKQVGQCVNRRVSDLTRELEDWKDKCNFWKKRFEDAQDRYNSLSRILDARTEKMEAYEDILKRRGIL